MKTLEELQSENERLKLMEANYKLWYEIQDRTIREIYDKYLKLQQEMNETLSSIEKICKKVI